MLRAGKFLFVAALAVLLSTPLCAQTPTISAAASSVPSRSFHNVLPPLADGTAWTCGGQQPSSYTSPWALYSTCVRFNLSTGAVVQSYGAFGYGYAHSPAFQLSDGRIVALGGMGAAGAAFQGLDVVQGWQPSDPTTQAWYHLLSTGGLGAGYDLSAVMLTSTLAMYAGGHGGSPMVSPTATWSRFDLAVVDFATTPPAVTNFPGLMQNRVYATVHAIASDAAIFIGGWNYSSTALERRNLDTIEIANTEGAITLFPQRLSAPVRYHSSQRIAGTSKIISFGGTSDPAPGRPNAAGNTNIIDFAVGTVTAGAAMNYPGYHMQSWQCVIGGKTYVYAFGGQSASGTARMKVEAYDVALNTWADVGTLTKPSVDHDRIASVGGPDVWVLGGEDPAIPAPTNWLTHLAFGAGASCSRN